MSAPLKLTPDQLRSLAEALDALTRITAETGVSFTSHGALTAAIGESNLRIYHDGERYNIDDSIGN